MTAAEPSLGGGEGRDLGKEVPDLIVLKNKQELNRKREGKRPIRARRVAWTENQDERLPCAEDPQTCLILMSSYHFAELSLLFCFARLLCWIPLERLAGAPSDATCGHLPQSTTASVPFSHHSQDTQRHQCSSGMGAELEKKALPVYHGLL